MQKKRGRKSAASLATQPIALLERQERPDAPYDLSDLAAEEWRAIVGRMPADWFPRETWPMLAQLCRHVVASRRLAMLIDAEENGEGEFDVDYWLRLLAAQERESRAISSLSGRMRLSHISTMRQDRTDRPGTEAPKPWEG